MVYELDGDTLKIAIGLANKPPTNISDKGQILWTLKRTKERPVAPQPERFRLREQPAR